MIMEELFKSPLTKIRQKNSDLNHAEFIEGKEVLKSYPRRLVFELTNRCNFNCIMCGRGDASLQSNDMPMSIIRQFEPCFKYVEEITLHGWGESTIYSRFFDILEFLDRYPMLRKYFVTNGSTLLKISKAIFDYHVDVFAVSLDGATSATNDSIRKGGNFYREISSLRRIIAEKEKRNLDYPHINFIFTAIRSNIHELPEMVNLAWNLGLPEIKVVYLTVFKEELLHETLLNQQELVRRSFGEARERAEKFNIKLKLPEIQGSGEAGLSRHKPCFFPWRDIYVGSDGYLRPCQASSHKLVHVSDFNSFEDLWNCTELQGLRRAVNNEHLMPSQCYNCYHSTCANWDLKHGFLQIVNE
ncbi:MAG: radical SAM protein [Nitrospirae bacterium]|nr:radical SAM protein [Nitrospirota bacterium]